ncbi:phytoene desaturase family protein [Nocardioides daeguensis]|uniref:NAD(P)/FAD-dependent oxidoreductase n=1 Tax=Nocardioides daeguensis TaxID=908359 RepID=A0ABP6UWB6_9ACTN|nr:NAD(P)/FAD-dependent oxidoreductase [Nocardioides daeguensis]MBV6726006.1 NAD(P)/FAD-dependent oxidoreductase [Nocardioides daeguensis]MCR1772478.1 NAD(P)/FAD-dependent oxidoreductase [Nocardioides daeguensis]
MRDSYDVVVIGSGINGLVAAAELAGAGRSVALLEERDRLGGFIASDELTVPGFVHDTFSSWHPLFQAGGAYADLGADLHRHGLSYRNAEGPVTASVSERGAVVAHRDPEETAAGFARAADRASYGAMLAELGRWAPHVFGALGSELRARDLARLGLGAVRGLGRDGLTELARVATQSGRGLTRERFAGTEVDQLWAPWLLHAGLAPDQATGGLMLPVMAFTMHEIGLPVVEGGAASFVAAFEALLMERGVEILRGTPAKAIAVRSGRAVGVDTGAGHLRAGAVLASTSTGRLYDGLLPPDAVGPAGRAAVARHRPGRAAAQIHLALEAPLRWSDSRLDTVPLVHVSNGSDSTAIACAQAEAGLLPAEPTVVVGQQCVLDPTRAPEGGATLWIQLQELPWRPVGDAAGRLDTSEGWTPALADAYAERVIDRIEQFAPGLADSVIARHVIDPTGLAAANANAVHGDPYGGAAELDQSLLWRPGTATGHRTGVPNVFHIGAFTHPGPGLGGGSGHLVAQQLIRRRAAGRRRRS